MSHAPSLQPVLDLLAECREPLDKLERLCCEPGRSPAMAELRRTIEAVRSGVTSLTPGFGAIDEVMADLEDAGAQIGRLQVGCCTPARMKFYSGLLDSLTKVQIEVNAAAGRRH